MDSVSDKEVEAIWKRINRYVNVKNIRSKSRSGVENELKNLMRQAGETSGQSGSMQTLIDHYFPRRAVEIDEIYEELTREVIRAPKRKPIKVLPTTLVPAIQKEKTTKRGLKLPIRIKGKQRLYKPENIQVSNSQYRGKPSYYIFNKRTGKRLTWGLY